MATTHDVPSKPVFAPEYNIDLYRYLNIKIDLVIVERQPSALIGGAASQRPPWAVAGACRRREERYGLRAERKLLCDSYAPCREPSPMPSQFALRDAVPEDASALAALSIEVWLNTYADEGVSKAYGDHLLEAFSVQAFTEQQDDRRIRTVVCHRHEYMLGYVKVLLDAQPPTPNSGTAEIVTLYVRERHKGRGIGSALLRRALAIGREAGHRSMFLIVNCNNARAIQFYRSHGMRFNGEWMYRFQNIEALNHVYVAESAERVSRSDEAS